MDATTIARLTGLKVAEVEDLTVTPQGTVFRHGNDHLVWTMPTEADELGQHGLLSLARHPRPGHSTRRYEGDTARAAWRELGIPA